MNKKIELLKLTDEALDKKVKIQGTEYDRKRKIPNSTIKKMLGMAKKQKSVAEIASKLGLNYTAVKYHVDAEFRKLYNATRNGKHTGKDHITVQNRIAYKRELVAAGKITA